MCVIGQGWNDLKRYTNDLQQLSDELLHVYDNSYTPVPYKLLPQIHLRFIHTFYYQMNGLRAIWSLSKGAQRDVPEVHVSHQCCPHGHTWEVLPATCGWS